MKRKRQLLIWGAGGHGKVVADVARSLGFTNIAFLDSQANSRGSLLGFPVFDPDQVETDGTAPLFVIAIGDNHVRARCFEKALRRGWEPTSLIHPAAVVSDFANVGGGTVVMARAVVNASATIGRNCILNSGAIVEHDCLIGNHVHVCPGVTLGGTVSIGSYAQIGLGSSILPNLAIGRESVIGAGSVVVKAVEDGVTVVGVPAAALQRKVVA